MFKKVFKKGNENELNIYDLAGRHINTLKELLDEYISKNKYKHQHELFELFDLLIEIEEDKRS